jgi:hypothetical protein
MTGLSYVAAMSEGPESEPPEEPPWEVNEYKFEPPAWFEWLIAGNPGVYPPLILVLVYLIWRWASG